MNRVCRIVTACALLLIACIPLLPATAIAQAMSAQESVDKYISTLLERMEEIKPLYESDRDGYFTAVEAALSEFVDFREVARGVMAKYGTGPNGATPAQLDRFSDVFRASLVDFYGSALANYGSADYEFLDTRESSNPENATNIRMSIWGSDGNRIEVQYTMFLDDARQWKLKNLYVEGVNLRRQYYSRFDSLMTRNDYDIDRVINLWQGDED